MHIVASFAVVSVAVLLFIQRCSIRAAAASQAVATVAYAAGIKAVLKLLSYTIHTQIYWYERKKSQ